MVLSSIGIATDVTRAPSDPTLAIAALQVRAGSRYAHILVVGNIVLGLTLLHAILVSFDVIPAGTSGPWIVLAGSLTFVGSIALGGYVYYLSKKPAEPDTAKKQEKVFTVESDKIEEIRITSAAGDATTLKKEGGAWQVKEPVAARADDSEVSGITSALSSVEMTRVVDENPANLNDYGLSNPRITLDFKATGDNDYVGQTGTLTFAPGETQKTVTVVVNGDGKKEADEYFFLDLFDNSLSSLFTKKRGTGTILNDD